MDHTIKSVKEMAKKEKNVLFVYSWFLYIQFLILKRSI